MPPVAYEPPLDCDRPDHVGGQVQQEPERDPVERAAHGAGRAPQQDLRRADQAEDVEDRVRDGDDEFAPVAAGHDRGAGDEVPDDERAPDHDRRRVQEEPPARPRVGEPEREEAEPRDEARIEDEVADVDPRVARVDAPHVLDVPPRDVAERVGDEAEADPAPRASCGAIDVGRPASEHADRRREDGRRNPDHVRPGRVLPLERNEDPRHARGDVDREHGRDRRRPERRPDRPEQDTKTPAKGACGRAGRRTFEGVEGEDAHRGFRGTGGLPSIGRAALMT